MQFISTLSNGIKQRPRLSASIVVLGVVFIILFAFSWYWSREPAVFWVDTSAKDEQATVGFATTDTLMRVAQTMLDKPGGFLANDVAPPSVFLDNIPSWEIGVLTQVRDLARVMRNDYSR